MHKTFMVLWVTLISLNMQVKASVPLEADDWTIKAQYEDVSIYTRPQPGSDYAAFKAVTILDAPLESVIAVMADPQSCLEWVKGCIVVEGFDEHSFNDRYAYSVNDMPWPVQDRDYIIHIRTTAREIPGSIVMHMTAAPNRRPPVQGRVRVTVSETHYFFTPTEDGRTRMIWLQHSEPGGILPSWLVNRLIVDIPLESIRALNALVHDPRYQGRSLIWSDGEVVGVSD